jgi:membrane-associated protease RseP (regulator of RpoE activity)
MPRRISLPLLLAISAGTLAAQEPRSPQPSPPDVIRLERTLPPGEGLGEGTVRVLVTRRARLGIFFSARPLETDSIGAVIERVTPNSPAARAGLRSGDIITRFNGKPLTGGEAQVGRGQSAPGLALTLMAASLNPGDTVAVEYRRGAQTRNVSIVASDEPYVMTWDNPGGESGFWFSDSVAAGRGFYQGFGPMRVEADSFKVRIDSGRVRERMRMPAPMMITLGTPLENLELAPLNRDLGRYFGTAEGILVINVPEESKLGLKAGDVVFSVDGRVPAGPAHLLRILRSYEYREPIRFEIMRMKKREVVVGSIGER